MELVNKSWAYKKARQLLELLYKMAEGGYKCENSINICDFIEQNTKNHVVGSNVSECMKELDCWMGIDEAGRGPVLGATSRLALHCILLCLNEKKLYIISLSIG